MIMNFGHIVYICRLDRHTVTFRVAEWRVIIAVLLIV